MVVCFGCCDDCLYLVADASEISNHLGSDTTRGVCEVGSLGTSLVRLGVSVGDFSDACLFYFRTPLIISRTKGSATMKEIEKASKISSGIE